MQGWQKLIQMTGDDKFLIKKVSLPSRGIQIEGEFQLPPLAELSMDDQVFVAAFIKTHGSIKQMEKLFDISYPTVKNRLKSIGDKLDFVDIDSESASRTEILERVEKGELSVKDAMRYL